MNHSIKHTCLLAAVSALSLLNNVFCQTKTTGGSAAIFTTSKNSLDRQDPFAKSGRVIENIGQYGVVFRKQPDMGKILYGYEGFGMPVLFTATAIIQQQRKFPKLDEEEKEKPERKGIKPEDLFEKTKPDDRFITMQWLGSNPNAQIVAAEKTAEYHSYGMLPNKAMAYRQLIYKDIYPGIDVQYLFAGTEKTGFEYRLIIHPGADISRIQLKIDGDVKKITLNDAGLLVKNSIGGLQQSNPVGYYEDDQQKSIPVNFKLDKNIISFSTAAGFDHARTFVIDPFVTATGNLTGLNAGKAKDVDFDYAGNVYVTGGGDYTTTHSLAKYNAAGALQWTFNGSLAIPFWEFGTYYGGWMVEKPTGNIYLGQGFNFSTGFQVIRVSTTGLYDNYITTANQNFTEAWKMFWNCNNGSPQILIAGGGINSDINFGIFAPPSTTVTSLNVTGISYTGSSGWAQDIADFVFDPANNDMYTIYGSLFGTPSLGNRMYKNTAPYSSASIAWNLPSGYNTVSEAANRPYLVAGGLVDNSANMLCVNASYLYYWDGKNLKAFNKLTGAVVGTPLVTANIPFMQGGIVVDACDNVFVGEANGNIKVYKFNGTNFNDAAAADITVPGFAGKHVYDLAYDEAKKLLYASGDGFVASFDIAAYCPTTFYTVNAVPNCNTNSVTATVTPAPSAGSTVTYTLYTGGTQVASNTTGIFTGINPNVSYTIIATVNLPCSGAQASATFTIPAPAVNTTQVNTACGASTGSISATGSITAGPYTYNLNGGTFQASGTFNGLASGIYTIGVKDAGGCPNSVKVTVINTNGPSLTFTQVNADCGSNNATVTANATGGTAPYQFSINNGTTYQSGNFFTGLVPGLYTLVAKDATGCTNSTNVTITSSASPLVTAIPAAATCGNNNGKITAFGTNGTAPLQYSINGNIFQPGNTFSSLTPGVYTITVKDANGCINTTSVSIANTPAPTVTATSTPAACSNMNGTITSTGNGGVAPLQYSINGGTFQVSEIFTGLTAGVYSISVQDFTGCVSSISVTVASTNGPSVTATTISSSCNASNGRITATATGGTPAYQYSLDGVNFQASNIFNGLAAGNYTLYTRDALGCFAAFAVIVTNTAGPIVTASATAASCSANDGSINATGSGGTTPYQYSIDGITFQGSNIFSGLAPNTTYTITIRDAAGCESTAAATVNNASGLTLDVSTITAGCNTNTGTITCTASGGVAPTRYSIDGTAYQLSNIFNSIAPGSYTVYAKDANNCIVTSAATVDAVSSASISVSVTDETCAGSNGIIEITAGGGIPPLTYSIDGVTFQNSGIFLNVAAGAYTAYLMDGSGCSSTQSVSISNTGAGPGISTFTVVTKGAYICNGESDGKITNPRVDGSNCNSCTFSLDFGPFIPNASQLFTNVPLGTHTVTAMDASGCTKTITVIVGEAVNSTASAVVTGTACNTSNGSITLTGIGPNSPYHVSMNGIGGPWIDFDPTTSFTGLAAGTYTFILSDDESFDNGDPGGCLDTIMVIVPSTGGPSISISTDDGTCAAFDGSITASGSGGTPPLEYSIDGSTFQLTGDFTGLGSGTYTITVQDGTGCSNSQEVTINNPAPPDVTAETAPASCGFNNGEITANGMGGTAPLQYSIDGFTFQASNLFTGLAAGNYNLYVKDANNCYSSIPLNIIAAPLPKVTAFTLAATCNASNGSIITNGTAGTPPYTYSIDGSVFQSSNIFSDLPAGFYTVSIRDDRGCVTTTGVSVGNTIAPTFTASATPAKCDNANGSITVTASGGTAPYQYSSNGGTSFQPGNILSSLLPGTYTIVVKDANGCIAPKPVLVGNTNGPQTLTALLINAACGLSNGTITATATGGVAPLQYSRDGVSYQASNVFNAVPAGNYTLYVRDANLCTKTLPVTLLNLPGPTMTAASSPASCGLNDGTVTANASGGTGILTYSKDGITFQASNIFLNLATGPYTITVKDIRGCTSTASITVATIGAAVTPTFTAIPPICSGAALAALPTTSLNGITGTWAPALNNTATTTYTFTPTAGLCATTATLTITVNPNLTPTFNSVAAICSGATLSALPTTSLNGITGTWSPALNNTATTTYTFTPTAGQCATSTTLAITVNPNLAPTFNSVAAICSGASLSALPTTSVNGITGTWSPVLNSTATTTYTFTPTAGQCATTTTLTITVNPNLTPTFNSVAAICSGATLSALPTTSLNGITGTWSPALNNTATTTYTFTPTAGQCATSTTLAITVNPNLTPTFNSVAAICSGATLSALPTTSLNGITGTWSPVLNNTATTTYTFTPTAGLCATTATLTITVNPNLTPTLNSVAAICSGASLSALPTISLNGITGTWSPALNNTATTVYTFTPTAGQCANTTTLTITVNTAVIPTFNPVTAICSGSALSALPTTSLNAITGTWSPALNNTATTIYTFTPTAGQCANTTTLTINVSPAVTPTFNPVAAICWGATLTALPTTSLNGITGTWAPALNNTATTIYTFTPTAGQCANTTTLTITVNQILSPTINCGVSTTSSVIFNWPGVAGATGYDVSYQVNSNPAVTIGPAGNVLTYQVTGLTAADNVTITVTPTGGAGNCFSAATATCIATACTPPTASIVYASPFCALTTNAQAVVLSGTGVFTGGTFSAPAGLSINASSGDIIPSASTSGNYTVNYTIPASGGCAALTATTPVTIDPVITPSFNPVAAFCSGTTLPPLPTISLNGITGTWSPALNNTITTIYTFTPTAGQCANTTTLTIEVNPSVTPTFNPVAAICPGDVLSALPTTSLDGITGVWTPALNNTATTVYTFTPTAGQCANTTTLTITVNPAVIPTFDPVAAICSGDILSPLPTTSLNGISGTWSPALNNSTTTIYTFTPAAGQCAGTTTITVTVSPVITPVFNPIGAVCQNGTAPLLPLLSNNGISGAWSPATINTSAVGTNTYNFTPAAGQCAGTASMDITVATQINPVFSSIGPLCINAAAPSLPATSNNGITGTWNPATINTSAPGTNGYIFTPAAAQCATATATLNITVAAAIVPSFAAIPAICSGDVLNQLPATSLNGISGTWAPALNNTATTTYTFTPDAGQCATQTTLTITVNPGTVPTFDAVGPLCQNSTAPILPTISNNGITGTWNPAVISTSGTGTTTYNFTPAAGQCASAASLNITIATQVTPSFALTGPLCQDSAAPALPAVSNNGITGTWNPAVISTSGTGTTTYNFTPAAGQCASAASLNITIATQVTPTFALTGPLCQDSAAPALPAVSNNGITGTWNPAVINTTVTGISSYTFTPATGQCATAAIQVNITISATAVPAFNPIAAICQGDALAPLPTTSLNGTSGVWSPALNNNATTTYTFTPNAGQCAVTTTLTITVSTGAAPKFNPVAAICKGDALAPLPTTSLNGIAGTWSPAINNNATTTYTFTPNAGLCAATASLTVTVSAAATPTFNPVAAICQGDPLTPLPTTSLNGITGIWSPALNSNATTTYTFTPNPGQCAATATATMVVYPAPVIFAGHDTTILASQPFTLNPVDVNNAGFVSHLWSPPDGLNNPFSQNPVAVLNSDADYFVTAATANGCEATDAIHIQVIKTSEIYVPTAFTPGGNNSLLHAFPVGIKQFKYFAIYNRYGQEVFRTTDPLVGWDGKFRGLPQSSAGFVWIAEGIDFKNRVITRKGNVVLVR